MKTNQKILRMVELAMLAAIIMVLQQIVIPLPGGLTLSLVLVPIVVGAVLFGPAAGAILGGVFGVVVTFLVVVFLPAMVRCVLVVFWVLPFSSVTIVSSSEGSVSSSPLGSVSSSPDGSVSSSPEGSVSP